MTARRWRPRSPALLTHHVTKGIEIPTLYLRKPGRIVILLVGGVEGVERRGGLGWRRREWRPWRTIPVLSPHFTVSEIREFWCRRRMILSDVIGHMSRVTFMNAHSS